METEHPDVNKEKELWAQVAEMASRAMAEAVVGINFAEREIRKMDKRILPPEASSSQPAMVKKSIVEPGYESLHGVLIEALNQAQAGKGKERHAKDAEPFQNQKICEITRRVGMGYPLGQAVKKAMESQRLDRDAGIAELLGAINYLAAAIIVMREG